MPRGCKNHALAVGSRLGDRYGKKTLERGVDSYAWTV